VRAEQRAFESQLAGRASARLAAGAEDERVRQLSKRVPVDRDELAVEQICDQVVGVHLPLPDDGPRRDAGQVYPVFGACDRARRHRRARSRTPQCEPPSCLFGIRRSPRWVLECDAVGLAPILGPSHEARREPLRGVMSVGTTAPSLLDRLLRPGRTSSRDVAVDLLWLLGLGLMGLGLTRRKAA